MKVVSGDRLRITREDRPGHHPRGGFLAEGDGSQRESRGARQVRDLAARQGGECISERKCEHLDLLEIVVTLTASRMNPGSMVIPKPGPDGTRTMPFSHFSEEVSLREGQGVRKVTKAEALLRGLIVGALKGESRSLGTLFRLAEHTGHFEDEQASVANVSRIIVSTGVPRNSQR